MRFETTYFVEWSCEDISLVVNQFIGLQELSFDGIEDGWFQTESYDEDPILLCLNLLTLCLRKCDYEFVIWILEVIEAPPLKTVHLTEPESPSREDDVADWDPEDATPHENVSELVIATSNLSFGPAYGFISFLIAAFPNTNHLEFLFGDIDMIYIFQDVDDRSDYWEFLNSLTLSEEDPYFHQGEYYESCLQHLFTFVQTYGTIQALTIESPMAMDRPLTTQLIRQLEDLVDEIKVGPDDGRPFGIGKPQSKGVLDPWE